jgi:hypothetical protein
VSSFDGHIALIDKYVSYENERLALLEKTCTEIITVSSPRKSMNTAVFYLSESLL